MMFQTVDTPVQFADITGEDAADTCRSTETITGLTRQNSAYWPIIRICEQVATAALQGADVRELTSVLARIIRKTIVLLNPAFELHCHAVGHGASTGNPEWDPSDPVIARLLDSLATEHPPLRVPAIPNSILTHDCLATPIMLGETILGYLLIIESSNERDADDVNLLIVSYVATLFAMPLAHERTRTDLGRRYRAAIVDSLVSGPLLFQQAETAIEIGTRIGRAGQVLAYDSLGIYKLLLPIGDLHQLRQFAEEVLGPVIDYDASHKVDLVRTLSVYLSQRDSLKRTARRLQVHTNTVSYRIQRIEQLSRLDPTNPDDQLLAHLAIKIINAQRVNNQQPDQLSDVRCQ